MKLIPILCVLSVCAYLDAVPLLTRGPYLQSSAPTAISVRWRTDTASLGTVRYGLAAGSLSQSVTESAPTTEHEVRLVGLTPSTRIFYQVEADATILATPSDCFFTSAPVTGSNSFIRFWAIGDSGTANANAAAVRDAYDAIHAVGPAHFMMMLGDNAYGVGADSEYQSAVFDFYPKLLRQLPLWTTIGNHETYALGGGAAMPYLGMFTLPTAGESGGVASGTKYYYSFNHGNIHFICLDSMVSSRAPNGAMAQWLLADLQANLQPWTVAFFHHPPYTKGSHNSDAEFELIEMRQNIIPILEGYGVDLVLNGHSHCYERSYLLDGHYGYSSSLTEANKKNAGSGNIDTTGPYKKRHIAMTPREGTVYVVNGSSGQISGGTLDHPAMFLSLNRLGSLVVDVAGRRMDVRFLRETGVVDDYFSIVKGPNAVPAAPSNLAALATTSTSAQFFWKDNSSEEDDFLLYGSIDGANFTAINPPLEANSFNATVAGLSPSSTYYFTLVARNELGYQGTSNIVQITTPAADPPISSLDLWRFNNFGTVAVTTETNEAADPDGDGHNNLIEYALGSLPQNASSRATLETSVSIAGLPQITFQRQNLSEVTYTVEAAEDITSPIWLPIFTSTGNENTEGPVTVPVSDFTGKKFLRLKITR